MPGLILSRDEVAELTRTPVKTRQLEFLRRNGIRHYVDLNGRPVVPRSAIEGEPTKPAAPAWRPNKGI